MQGTNQLHGLLMSDKQPKLRFTQSEFKFFRRIIYPLERKDRNSLRDVLEQNDKVTIH